MHQFYEIVVQYDWKDPRRFALFNKASGAYAGDRLFKGSDIKEAAQRWPFKSNIDWVRYDDRASAEAAAKKLQTYLEARERCKTKKPK